MHGPQTLDKLQDLHISIHRTALRRERHNFLVKNCQIRSSPGSRSVSPGSCSSINRDICNFLCWSTISHFALLLLCGDSQRINLRPSQELVVGLRYGVAACRRLQLESNKVIVHEDKLCCAAAVDALCIACCSIRKVVMCKGTGRWWGALVTA